jgi:hypothetical protein
MLAALCRRWTSWVERALHLLPEELHAAIRADSKVRQRLQAKVEDLLRPHGPRQHRSSP